MTDTHSRLCKVGLILPEAEFDMGGQTAGWRDYVTMAGVAEDIGVDSLWFVDHLLYRGDATSGGCLVCCVRRGRSYDRFYYQG